VNLLERELVKTITQLELKEGSVADDAKRLDAAQKAFQEVRMDHLNFDILVLMSR
jgi:hypothetical protein